MTSNVLKHVLKHGVCIFKLKIKQVFMSLSVVNKDYLTLFETTVAVVVIVFVVIVIFVVIYNSKVEVLIHQNWSPDAQIKKSTTFDFPKCLSFPNVCNGLS